MYAFADANGNGLRDLHSEDALLYDGVVDVLGSDATGIDIVQRTISGTIADPRDDPAQGI